MPTITRFIAIIFLFLVRRDLHAQIPSQTFYVSPAGNDNDDGHSPLNPWKTLDKINQHKFLAGDRILLEGGMTFTGTIQLDSADRGTQNHPILVSTYGRGKAIIDAGDSMGLYGYNCSGITVRGIHFKGNGVGKNSASGIFFYSDLLTHQPSYINIDNCTVQGFQKSGIMIGCADGENVKGFNHVNIFQCVATENGEAGIASYGGQTRYHHTNFQVRNCKVYSNKGIPTKTENHSGNGIVLGGIENVLIEYCDAFDNGADNHCTAGGPVGIWVWLCKKATIQYCESHHNHAGLTKDGGGFDIDGGSSECVIQYNYSHDNEGAGYLLAEYGALLPFVKDTVRFNISENDGRKNSYGAITIWGVDKNFQVRNSIVYNNTIFLNDKSVVNGTPCAVQIMGLNMTGVVIANNLFLTAGKTELLNSSDPVDTSNTKFISNNYFSYDNQPIFKWNKNIYRSLAEWKTGAASQESFKGRKTGSDLNPQFKNPGSGQNPDGKDSFLARVSGYIPEANSSIRKLGLKLGELGVKKDGNDLFGKRLVKNGKMFMGCSQ